MWSLLLLAFLPPGDHVRTVAVAGTAREYVLHVPRGQATGPWPVLLAFHGGASNARALARHSGLSATADARGFLAVYPEGTGRLDAVRTWNAGPCCGHARREDVDEVAFVRAVLADLATVARVDPARVYATGMSNGAMLTYRLAAALPDRLAAVAPVAGIVAPPARTGPGTRPVPVVHFHGTEDAFAPFAGGRGSRSLTETEHAVVPATVAAWAARNGCGAATTREPLPDREDDATSVSLVRFEGCPEGGEVVLYVVEGGGHTWPGHPPELGVLGRTTREIDANAVMWAFLSRYRLPAREGRRSPE